MSEQTPSPPASAPTTTRRAPTAAEARALGHPTRLKIVFACRDRAMTNKELAEVLGTTPGTIHYHLRPLVEEGFLRPEEPRRGPRGSKEQPYRSTGKSWEISGSPGQADVLRQVAAEELLSGTDEDTLSLSRLGATLPRPVLQDLVERMEVLFEEARATSRDGAEGDDLESVTIVLGIQRQHRPSGVDGS